MVVNIGIPTLFALFGLVLVAASFVSFADGCRADSVGAKAMLGILSFVVAAIWALVQ